MNWERIRDPHDGRKTDHWLLKVGELTVRVEREEEGWRLRAWRTYRTGGGWTSVLHADGLWPTLSQARAFGNIIAGGAR